MIIQSRIRQFVLLGTLCGVLAGCGRGEEFRVSAQEGAIQSGVYPRFSNKPKAATEQFSEDDRIRLTKQLDTDARRAKAGAGAAPIAASSVGDAKAAAQREAEETIRQIESSGKR